MPKLLYSARTPDGKQKSGWVEATTAQQAVADLSAAGLTDIQLHEAPATAALRTHRESLLGPGAERMAAFELRVRAKPGLRTVLAEVARQSRAWLVVDVAIIAWGAFRASASTMAFGFFLAVLPFALTAWKHRHARHYNELMRAYAVGDWPKVQALLAALRAGPGLTNLQFDLDIREACMRAAQGVPPDAAALEKWRGALAQKSPGLFEGRLAAVYSAAGDYARCLELMRNAYELSSDDPSRRVDLALAEARFGDADRAEDLLNGVDERALPAFGKPFIHWARGIVALKRGRDSARADLEQAVAIFLPLSAHPATWTPLGVCAGAYALSLARAGRAEAAASTLKRVWPVLKAHGDRPLLTMIRREIRIAEG
jgi:tetratricopeptide (TPR) repeat protein